MWPVAALGLLLIYNAVLSPGFFNIVVRDGHLYGSIVDVLHRAAPVLLLALGMTLVIATGGVDLSVGAVMAIAGASRQLVPTNHSVWRALLAALAASLVCGLINGLLVAALNIQPIVATLILMVAGRGIAQLLSDGQMITVYGSDVCFTLGGGHFFGLPFASPARAWAFLLTHLLVRTNGRGIVYRSRAATRPPAASQAYLPDCECGAYIFAGSARAWPGLVARPTYRRRTRANQGFTWNSMRSLPSSLAERR